MKEYKHEKRHGYGLATEKLDIVQDGNFIDISYENTSSIFNNGIRDARTQRITIRDGKIISYENGFPFDGTLGSFFGTQGAVADAQRTGALPAELAEVIQTALKDGERQEANRRTYVFAQQYSPEGKNVQQNFPPLFTTDFSEEGLRSYHAGGLLEHILRGKDNVVSREEIDLPFDRDLSERLRKLSEEGLNKYGDISDTYFGRGPSAGA